MTEIKPPSRWLFAMEGRSIFELGSLPYFWPLLRRLPKGDGHSVLVLPGFLTTSRSTGVLRWFLNNRGYRAHRWKQGRNRGFSSDLGTAMNQRLREIHEESGRKVSLVGWSLGGVYARELARDAPECVRQVITLGSPFRGRGHGSNVASVYRAVAGVDPSEIEEKLLDRLAEAPPSPTTAVFSKGDGIVSWRTTIERITHPRVENVGVFGAHCGLGHNPGSWVVMADRLAQPEGEWTPFVPREWQRYLFRGLQNQNYSSRFFREGLAAEA